MYRLALSSSAALLLCLLAAGNARGESQAIERSAVGAIRVASALDPAPKLPADLRSVASGGYWEDGERSGILRVIVIERGEEQVSSLVFLEWLQEQPGKPARRVGHAAVTAINDSAGWSVDMPVLRPSETGLLVELPAAELGSYVERRFVLTVPVKGVGRFEMR